MTKYTETHLVEFEKPAQRQLRDKVIASNLTALLASTNNKSLAVRGWTINAEYNDSPCWHRSDNPNDDGHIYTLFVRVDFAREDGHAPGKTELSAIVRTMATRASQPAFGKWTLARVDSDGYVPVAEDDIDANIGDIGYTETDIPEDWDAYFNHLFGLGSHIKRVRKALEAGMSSN